MYHPGAVHELWEQTGRKGTATEVRKLEDELITLRQQLHREQSALKEKDTQFDSLRKKVIKCTIMYIILWYMM